MSEEIVAIPLLQPSAGTPEIIDTEEAFRAAVDQLAQGSGPFAVDAERASGFRYSARAYLIQIKRTDGGLHLIDPIPNSACKYPRSTLLARTWHKSGKAF